MSIADKIIITISKNQDKAVLQFAPPEATRDDIDFAIKAKGIKAGIDWKEIERQLEFNNGKNPITNLTIAKSVELQVLCQFLGENLVNGNSELIKVVHTLITIGKELSGSNLPITEKPAYVENGSEILSLEIIREPQDILGNIIASKQFTPPPIDQKTLVLKKREKGFLFKSLKAGYLACQLDGTFSIIDPVVLSDDNMLMEFILAPVKQNGEMLLNRLLEITNESPEEVKCPIPENQEIEEIITGDSVKVIQGFLLPKNFFR